MTVLKQWPMSVLKVAIVAIVSRIIIVTTRMEAAITFYILPKHHRNSGPLGSKALLSAIKFDEIHQASNCAINARWSETSNFAVSVWRAVSQTATFKARSFSLDDTKM